MIAEQRAVLEAQIDQKQRSKQEDKRREGGHRENDSRAGLSQVFFARRRLQSPQLQQ